MQSRGEGMNTRTPGLLPWSHRQVNLTTTASSSEISKESLVGSDQSSHLSGFYQSRADDDWDWGTVKRGTTIKVQKCHGLESLSYLAQQPRDWVPSYRTQNMSLRLSVIISHLFKEETVSKPELSGTSSHFTEAATEVGFEPGWGC